MATILTLSDMVYATSMFNSETCFLTQNEANGFIIYGQNGTDAIEPDGTVGAELGDNVTGTWRFETNDTDQSEDFWVANGQCDDTSVVDYSKLWIRAENNSDPADGGWDAINSDSFDTWYQMSASINRGWEYTRAGTNDGTPVSWNGSFDLYVLEKATTPTGTASAEGATLIGSPSLTIFNSGTPG
jgi:hypothetical protein